jgi:hypothetical protein
MEDLKRRMREQMGMMRIAALSQVSQNMCLLIQGDDFDKLDLGVFYLLFAWTLVTRRAYRKV